MADLLPLHLFPEGGLDGSITTTVWVGVFVVAFLNLRIGWVLSGLVVPGYMVPLLITKPWAFVIVTFEGILTYLLVYGFSERLGAWGRWCSLFGRDRFFGLLLTSIAVRVVLDGWLLPELGEAVNARFGLEFDYRNNLHSFGLIVVSLIANLFWKPGLLRGLVPFAVTVGTTYLIVRYGLMELTNFHLSGLGYAYEDIAASMLASPKAYVILIMTGFLASRMNLLYGWDFNGILIPALIALQWYEPTKVLTTWVEALVILGASSLVLSLPWLQKVTVEGARKLLLFFNVGFAYKMLLGYAVPAVLPEIKVTDVYGFGYLLATLMAVKMHDKGILVRLSRSTLQTSLVAVGTASVLGFLLTFAPMFWTVSPTDHREGAEEAGAAPGGRLVDVLRAAKVGMYRAKASHVAEAPLPQEIDRFGSAVRRLAGYAGPPDTSAFTSARRELATLGYTVHRIEDRYLFIHEREPRRGWGIYILDPSASGGLVVEVPSPLDEPGTLEAGASLFAAMGGQALSVAGIERREGALATYDTLFHAFHRALARHNVVQVRSDTAKAGRLPGRREGGTPAVSGPRSRLWVTSELPAGLSLARLRGLIEGFDIDWGASPGANLQRAEMRSGFAELWLNREDTRELLFRPLARAPRVEIEAGHLRIDGYLQAWLLASRDEIAERGTDLYRPPSIEELLYFDHEVLTPLIEIAAAEYGRDGWSEAGQEELSAAAAAAEVLGYRLIQYRYLETGREYLILKEDPRRPARGYRGTYVLRLGEAQGFVVEVPRPLYEMNSFEYGVSLFESLAARALLTGGAHPTANRDRSSDLMSVRNQASLFTLVHQVLLREAGDEPLLVVQVRAYSARPDRPQPDADALLAFADGTSEPRGVSPLGRALLDAIAAGGLTAAIVDGSPETAGYEAGGPQALFLAHAAAKELAALWLSPEARAGYRQQSDNRAESSQFLALGIRSVEMSLARLLLAPPTGSKPGLADSAELSPELRVAIEDYLRTRDVVRLDAIRSQWPHHALRRVIDDDSGQSFLVVYASGGWIALVANLHPTALERRVTLPRSGLDRAGIVRFIASRAAWLEFGEMR